MSVLSFTPSRMTIIVLVLTYRCELVGAGCCAPPIASNRTIVNALAMSCLRNKSNASETVRESRTRAEPIPLRPDRKIDETGIARVDRAVQMPDGRIEIAKLAVKQRQLHRR